MTLFASDGSTLTVEPAPADDAPNPEIIDAETEPADDTRAPVEPAPEPDGDVVDAEVVTDLATTDEQDADNETWAHEPDWAHDELAYPPDAQQTDILAIRIPQQNALTSLYQATQTCSDDFAMKMATKFVKRHLSEKTLERVLERMMDPDDPDYSKIDGVWNDLLSRISSIGGERVLKNAKALAAAKNGKAK